MLAGAAGGVALTSGSSSNAQAAAGTPKTPKLVWATRGGGPGGHHETVTDASVAANAIGIGESALTTALAKGQTLAQVATANGSTAQKVIDALVADGKTELAAAVTAGTITQAQADAAQTELVQRVTAQVNNTFDGGHRGFGPGGPGGGPHETVSDASVAANAIGISESAVTAALAKGQTLAQIATANGATAQKVIDALVADGKTELAAQVKAGTVTQAQADAITPELTQRATGQVNGTFGGPGGPGGHMHGPDGDGPHFG